jgi:stage V sporulation protein SpoVS
VPTARVLIALGLALRLFVALSRTDRHWHDEHYQTLEPAYFLVHGYGVLSWEWLRGFRSWALPLAHAPLIALASALGAKGLAASAIARCAYALADVWVLQRWVAFVVARSSFEDERRRETARTAALAAMMLSPTLCLWGVSTLQDHLATLLLYAALPTAWRLVDDPRAARWFAAGALLAAPALAKLQVALFTAPIALALLYAHRDRARARDAIALCAGALAVALGSALLDLATIGSFGASTVNQLLHGEALSRSYATSPPWRYLTALPALVGVELTAIAIALAALSLGRARVARSLLDPTRVLAPGAVLFVLGLSAIPHKEPRFILPVIPLVIVAVFNDRTCRAIERVPARVAPFALCLVAVYAFASVRVERIELSDSDVARLEESVRRRALAARAPRVTLCLLGQHWSQMRGSLGVSAPVRYEDALAYDRVEDALARCDFAVVRASHQAAFDRANGAHQWRATGEHQSGCALWVRAR